MTVYIPSKDTKKYVYRFQIDGETYRGRTGETDKRKAQAVERRMLEEAQRRRVFGRVRSVANPDDLTVKEACENYLTRLETEKGETATLAYAEANLAYVIRALGADTLMRNVTHQMINQLVAVRRRDAKINPASGKAAIDPKTGKLKLISGATVNRTTWQAFRPVYMMARDVWEVPMRPVRWKGLKVREAGERLRTLGYEEELRILAEDEQGYGSVFRFSLASGLRRTNLVGLRWSQVDLEEREITILQKGDRTHTLTIDDEMLDLLAAEKGRDPVYVWTYVARKT